MTQKHKRQTQTRNNKEQTTNNPKPKPKQKQNKQASTRASSTSSPSPTPTSHGLSATPAATITTTGVNHQKYQNISLFWYQISAAFYNFQPQLNQSKRFKYVSIHPIRQPLTIVAIIFGLSFNPFLFIYDIVKKPFKKQQNTKVLLLAHIFLHKFKLQIIAKTRT